MKVLTDNVMEETNEELPNFTIGFVDDSPGCQRKE